jgi:hypothetical protein
VNAKKNSNKKVTFRGILANFSQCVLSKAFYTKTPIVLHTEDERHSNRILILVKYHTLQDDLEHFAKKCKLIFFTGGFCINRIKLDYFNIKIGGDSEKLKQNTNVPCQARLKKYTKCLVSLSLEEAT